MSEEEYFFKSKSKWYPETGDVDLGVIVKKKEVEHPDRCGECGRWFEENETAYSGTHKYIFENWKGEYSVAYRSLGKLCANCFKLKLEEKTITIKPIGGGEALEERCTLVEERE